MTDVDLMSALQPGIIHTWLVDIEDLLYGIQDMKKIYGRQQK